MTNHQTTLSGRFQTPDEIANLIVANGESVVSVRTPGWVTWEGAKVIMNRIADNHPTITSITLTADGSGLVCGFVRKCA